MRNVFTKKRVSYLLALVPIIMLGSYLFQHAINVPFWDQWEIVPIIQHVKSGNFYFHDFWQQHNEHRLLFPRLFMLASAVLTSWDLRAEILISFVLALLSFGFILKIINDLEEKKGFKTPFLLPFVLGSIWFSLLQYENWLWGWQIQWYLNVFAISIVLYAVSKIIRKPDYSHIALALMGAFIAQYSLGNGVLIWPLLILAFIYLRIGYKKIGITAIAALFSTGLYYFNYTDPEGDSSKTLILEKPIEYVKYISGYMGRPLTYHVHLALILGFLMASFFALICIYLYFKKPESFRNSIPFIMLGLYSIASALITGLSRLGLGVMQSMTSRYTTISSLLLVSTIVIVVYNSDIFSNILRKAYKPVAYILTAIIIYAIFTNMNWGRLQADEKTQYLKDIKGCTSQSEPYQICLLSTYPNEAIVDERLDYLKQVNWGGY